MTISVFGFVLILAAVAVVSGVISIFVYRNNIKDIDPVADRVDLAWDEVGAEIKDKVSDVKQEVEDLKKKIDEFLKKV